MQRPSDISVKNEIENFSRPKIVLTDDEILISDPPFAKRIFFALFFLALMIISLKYYTGPDRIKGAFITSLFFLGFIYDSLSLKRVRIDLKKIAYFAEVSILWKIWSTFC